MKKMKYLHHTKTSTMMKLLKMEKMKKVPKKRNTKMSTYKTGEMIQVTTSSKIETKMTKETPPLKMTAQKK